MMIRRFWSNLLLVSILRPDIKVRILGRLRKLLVILEVRSNLHSTLGRAHEELLLGQGQVKPRLVVGVNRVLHVLSSLAQFRFLLGICDILIRSV